MQKKGGKNKLIMDEAVLVAGFEMVQVEDAQRTENLKASEGPNGITTAKLQGDSSKSGEDSALTNEKDASAVKEDNQEEEKAAKKIRKKGAKKSNGDANMDEKLECHSHSESGDDKSESGDDSSGSKSGSGDDSSGSKSGSGSDSKSASANAALKEGNIGEKKKALKKKIAKKLKAVASSAIKPQCDSSDSKSGSGDDSGSSKSGSGDDSGDSKSNSGDDSKSECSANEKEAHVLKGSSEAEKKKVLRKKIKKGTKNKEEAGNKDTTKCPNSNMGENTTEIKGNKNQTAVTEHDVAADNNMGKAKAPEGSEVMGLKGKDGDTEKKIEENEAYEPKEKEKKSIIGKIMEKLPGYR